MNLRKLIPFLVLLFVLLVACGGRADEEPVGRSGATIEPKDSAGKSGGAVVEEWL